MPKPNKEDLLATREKKKAKTSYTQLNLYPTKFSNSKNALYSRNENPELKIIHYENVDLEEIIMFWKQKSKVHYK